MSQILTRAGFPADILILDFETTESQSCNLGKLDIYPYLKHPDFLVYLLGVQWRNQTEVLDKAGANAFLATMVDLYGPQLDRVTVVGHNLYFDCAILKLCYGIVPLYTVDTRNLASAFWPGQDLSLGALAERMGRRKLDRLAHSDQAMFDFAYQEAIAYCQTDIEITRELLERLLPRLAVPEVELPWFNQHLQMFLRDSLRLDPAIDGLGRQIESSLRADAAIHGLSLKDIRSSKLIELVQALDPSIRLKSTDRGPMLPISKDDPERKDLLNHPDPKVRDLIRIRIEVQAMQSYVARVHKLQSWSYMGTLPVCLRPNAAVTGRSGGFGGINFANFANKTGGLGDQIRTYIRPKEGHVIVTLDYAAIEARILAWLADETDLLEAFASGVDVYSQMGSRLFKTEVRKPRPDDLPEVSDGLRRLRHISKGVILGCGYGLSAKGLHRRLGKAFSLSQDECAELVNAYRQLFPSIVRLWKELADSFIRTVRTSKPHRVRAIRQIPIPGGVVTSLPSGRRIYYHNVSVKGRDIIANGKGLWHGTLIENVVQAIARDILTYAVLLIEQSGIPVAYHIYDSIGIVCPKESTENVLTKASKYATMNPRWATGLPLAVEAKVSEHFE